MEFLHAGSLYGRHRVRPAGPQPARVRRDSQSLWVRTVFPGLRVDSGPVVDRSSPVPGCPACKVG